MELFETIQVDTEEVACDGGKLGHPKIYLHIDRFTGSIQCPYCSRLFVLKKDAHKGEAA